MDPKDEATARILADLDYLGHLMLAGALPDRTPYESPKGRTDETSATVS